MATMSIPCSNTPTPRCTPPNRWDPTITSSTMQTMSAEVGEQLALRDDLRQALDRGQLEVYYQPIVDAAQRPDRLG